MAQLKYCDKHNQVGFLRKPDESVGFAEIVDFLQGFNLRYALSTNLTIYDSLVKQFWQTATANTIVDGTLELHATIDTTEYTITEASIKDKLHLANASGSHLSSIPDLTMNLCEHTFEEPSPAHQHFSPPQEHVQGTETLDQLMTRVDGLEKDLKQTKLTMGSAIVKLVKKVKKLEGILKRKNVVFSDFEEEEPEDQGRKREEQVEDISPNTLEVAKTLSRVASQKPKSIDKGRRYKRRKETKGKKVVTSLDFQEEVNTGAEDEDWDLIRAKIEANAELSKKERAKAKRNKPMTQSQLRTYMMNYLKNQGTWKLSQLKNLCFKEVKEEFDKLVKQTSKPASKRLKSDEQKMYEPAKKTGRGEKYGKEKIIKQGERGVYQIIREDGTDIMYINFGAMLKDITRDDLTELYRIVMNRYGLIWSPEDELNKKLQGGKLDEDCYKLLKWMEKQAGIRK
ncbi:hypothetical protein Tco_0408480 [Tanacetum coccineum]